MTSFYNSVVRILRFLAVACLCGVAVLCAQNALPPGTPQAYTLPPEKLEQAKAFAFTRDLLYFASTATTLLILALLVRFRTGPAIRNFAERVSNRSALVTLLAAAPLVFIVTVLDLPWDAWAQSVSLRYGISLQSWPSWLWDWAKAETITLLIGTLVVAGFYWLLRRSPRRWWLWAWLASLPLTVAAVFLTPLVIDPLFNRFEPLAATHPTLVPPIEQILGRAQVAIPRDRLFEMIASDKTTALNAYVTGIGASKRVVLYDTIIKAEPPPELMTTFGHELGHYVLNHIPKGILFSAVVTLLGFVLCYGIVTSVLNRRAHALDIRGPADIASLPLFALVALSLSFLADPVANAFSRWQEHQADVYSLEVTAGVIPNPGAAAARAFEIEGERDLEDPTPNRFIVFWMYTHPPVAERLRFALEYHPAVPRFVH